MDKLHLLHKLAAVHTHTHAHTREVKINTAYHGPSNHPSVRPSVRPPIQPSIRPSVHPSIHPSIHSVGCLPTRVSSDAGPPAAPCGCSEHVCVPQTNTSRIPCAWQGLHLFLLFVLQLLEVAASWRTGTHIRLLPRRGRGVRGVQGLRCTEAV